MIMINTHDKDRLLDDRITNQIMQHDRFVARKQIADASFATISHFFTQEIDHQLP
jgi:hypothetical protein